MDSLVEANAYNSLVVTIVAGPSQSAKVYRYYLYPNPYATHSPHTLTLCLHPDTHPKHSLPPSLSNPQLSDSYCA